MDVQNNPLFIVFEQIDEFLRYKSASESTGTKANGTTSDKANHLVQIREYTVYGKRKYNFLLNNYHNFINLGIKEDGGTRTVFNGKIYSLQNFIYIDMLTQ